MKKHGDIIWGRGSFNILFKNWVIAAVKKINDFCYFDWSLFFLLYVWWEFYCTFPFVFFLLYIITVKIIKDKWVAIINLNLVQKKDWWDLCSLRYLCWGFFLQKEDLKEAEGICRLMLAFPVWGDQICWITNSLFLAQGEQCKQPYLNTSKAMIRTSTTVAVSVKTAMVRMLGPIKRGMGKPRSLRSSLRDKPKYNKINLYYCTQFLQQNSKFYTTAFFEPLFWRYCNESSPPRS